jgi:hypothetical protein
MWNPAWLSFMAAPVYLHGPPVTAHTRFATCTLSPGLRSSFRAFATFGFALSVAFTYTRSMKSSTTAEIG